MKKTGLLLLLLMLFASVKAQWTDSHESNNKIALCSEDASEIYVATNESTGDTYVMWCAFGGNGWSPFLQRINQDGVPQWDEEGIHIGGLTFSSYSEGISMVTTTDGGVVSCFADYEGYTYAVKINPDGTFAWGEQGIRLFDGHGFSRTEMTAGTDGGFWALGSDYDNLFVQYVNADGTVNPLNTISSADKSCMFGQLTLSNDNNVFVTYEQLGSGFYTDKSIHVVGFQPDGFQISQDIELMTAQTFQSTYIHYAMPDGKGGGYVYIWHPAIEGFFNVYVFHFDDNGNSTISEPYGIPVHSYDAVNYYLNATASVDPVTHDLLIIYEQTDAAFQSIRNLYVNRIKADGSRPWDDGYMIYTDNGIPIDDAFIDVFPDGSGFSVIASMFSSTGETSTIEAFGYTMDVQQQWSTMMSSTPVLRSLCEFSTGYHHGQTIITWVNGSEGGLYGQNIQPNGVMGNVVEPLLCPGPENFQGEYRYDMEAQDFGVLLSWEVTDPVDVYRLYRTDLASNEETIIEVPGDLQEYYDSAGIGTFKYQLKALFADVDCGFSLPATTPTGEDYVTVEVTSVPEHATETIVSTLKVYTMTGQLVSNAHREELSTGVYIIQGLTQDGRLIHKKVYIP